MRAGAAHLRKEGDDEQRAGRMESVPEPDADSAELDAARRHAPDPDTAVELPTGAAVAPEPLALGPLAEVAAVGTQLLSTPRHRTPSESLGVVATDPLGVVA